MESKPTLSTIEVDFDASVINRFGKMWDKIFFYQFMQNDMALVM